MPVPRSRESYAQRLDIETDLARLVGRSCAAWINARPDGPKIELIATRNYVPPQTAFYATWLVFGDEAVAGEFLDAYPQFRLDGRIAKIEADRTALMATLNTASSAATSTWGGSGMTVRERTWRAATWRLLGL